MKRGTRKTSFIPKVESLEDRCVPSLTHVVMDNVNLVHDGDAASIKADGSPETQQGVYWLADANFAASAVGKALAAKYRVKGINKDGSMTWQTALNFVDAMNDDDYAGHKNWTLPLTPNDGTADQYGPDPYDNPFGFNFKSSLFGHLFYNEFGGQAGDNIADLHNSATALFKNFQPYYYWGGDFPGSTRFPPSSKVPLPVDFSFNTGYLATDAPKDFEYALPEFSVDPTDQPVPPKKNETVHSMTVSIDPQLARLPGNQLVRDAASNITWLADANFAASEQGRDLAAKYAVQGINKDGSMTWPTANQLITAMNAADYLGHNNWRMPTSDAEPTQDYYRYQQDNTTNYDEMAELYFVELGGQAGSTILRTPGYEQWFNNFQPYLYWTETEGLDNFGPKPNTHKTFSFGNGFRSDNTDPNEMYVLPVYDGPQKVTNDNDSGPGSLRDAILNAHPGDTIVFDSSLAGTTILLQTPIDIAMPLDIEWLGAGRLTISGQGITNLFIIGPYTDGTTVKGRTTTIIARLTLADGLSDKGGAILDKGASLTLKSDVFLNDHALGKAGGDGLGGALAIFGHQTTDMVVRITDCQFRDDSASGSDSGGIGAGGAIYLDAQNSTFLLLWVHGSRFQNDSAMGGAGGDARGGALFFTGATADNPTLDVVDSVFSSDSAIAGNGGGSAMGGAVYFRFASFFGSAARFAGDTFRANDAVGGRGEDGAFDGSTGGAGGSASGGAMALIVNADSGTTRLVIRNSKFLRNAASGGAGGTGGPGLDIDDAGVGGDGGSASGGALYLRSFGGPRDDTWTLKGVDVSENSSISGDGGPGGAASHIVGIGGGGGNSNDSYCGGIYDEFGGTLELRRCEITENDVADGDGGAGGSGHLTGQHGIGSHGFGGGLYVDASATADATHDTHIRRNRADIRDEVWGDLGRI
jgi:hypothetical protein